MGYIYFCQVYGALLPFSAFVNDLVGFVICRWDLSNVGLVHMLMGFFICVEGGLSYLGGICHMWGGL